jgi:hypothetical protein
MGVWAMPFHQKAFRGDSRVSLIDEDVDIFDRDDEDAGRVFSSRNPEAFLRDDGEAEIVEDGLMATMSLMPAKADLAWIRAPDA